MSTDLPDLAGERFGGTVVAMSDEFFGPAVRLLLPDPPVARPKTYDEHGQWMDGWETRRHRAPDSDWVVVRLGAPGVVRTVVVDTSFFDGNQPQSASLEGTHLPGNPSPEEVLAADWTTLLPDTALRPDAVQEHPVVTSACVTHVRLTAVPDGGVARLRLHGEVLLDPRTLDDGLALDLAAGANGAVVEEVSDMHFGSRSHLVAPGEPRTMGEGWETRRSRVKGEDWARVRLAAEGVVHRVVVDTRRFRGNAPRGCRVEASVDGTTWVDVLGDVRLQPDQVHVLPLRQPATARWLRLVVHPDGGVARLHAWGRPTAEGRSDLGLRWLNALPVAAAEAALLTTCGSSRWASRMVAARPLADWATTAQEVWDALEPADWEQALAAHPRIGDRPSAGTQEQREQSAAESADISVLEQIALGNAAYEARFARTYVVRAAGRSAEEMLAILQERLVGAPADELLLAAAQQAEITHLRLARLIEGSA